MTTLRDAAGRVTNLTDGAVSAAYTWDARRNRSVALTVHGTASLILSNGWNVALGVRTNLTWTLPSFILQPSSFSLLRGPGTNRIAGIVREDASRAEIGYDADGRLTSWSRRRADGSTDATREYAYSYDEVGNVVRAGRVDAAGQGRAAFEADAFNFHAVRRWNAVDLVGVAREDAQVLVDGKPVLRDGRRFVYSLSLVEGAPAHVTNLTLLARVSDDDEEWVAQRSVTLRLPACPEAIDVALAGATVGDSLTEYLFDARNRLRRVTDKVGAPRLRATYDYYPDGRRARKIVSVWTNDAWQASSTNQFMYDRWNLVREVVASDGATTTRDYTWGLDLDGLQSGAWGQESGGIGGLLAITEVSGTSTNILLPISDHVGTVHALVAVITNNVTLETPTVIAEYEYAPYGELISADGVYARSCPYGFQSKYRDPITGFWYYGYRFYDARACKWLTADPLGEAGGLNLTAFCGGDPVSQVDPLGLEPGDWCGDMGPSPMVTSLNAFHYAGSGSGAWSREDAYVWRMALVAAITEQRVQALSDYLSDAGSFVLRGEYYKGDVNAAGIVGSVGIGLLGIDLPADARDVYHNFTHWEWNWGHAGNTTLNAVGLLPLIGAVKHVRHLKYLDKGGEVVEQGLKSGRRLSKRLRSLSEAHLKDSGITVLGHYSPEVEDVGRYIVRADELGASYFDLGKVFDKLNPVQQKAANLHFLDVIAARGDEVRLSVSKMDIKADSSLLEEVNYLVREKGYRWVNQWSLRKVK